MRNKTGVKIAEKRSRKHLWILRREGFKTKAWLLRLATLGFAVIFSISVSAQGNASLHGSVKDELGASIVGAKVTLTSSGGAPKIVTTDADGVFSFFNLSPADYKVRASAARFATSEEVEVEVSAYRRDPLNITLKIASIESQVKINAEVAISTDPSSNADQTVVSGRDLDALPDGPEELAAALQALALSYGPDGGEIFVDGFSNGSMPRKESIREVRINQNPFAAEYDLAGGRVDILTKPGGDQWHGAVTFNFNDESLNSRNPFQISSSERAPFQVRRYGGSFNGPLKKKKASIFVDVNRDEIDDNQLIRATILDGSLDQVQVGEVVLVPRRDTNLSLRLDYAINPGNTLVARFNYEHYQARNLGANGFSLPERSFDYVYTSPSFQITETSVLNAATVNETRLSYSVNRTRSQAAFTSPALNVIDSFVGGGSATGRSATAVKRWELQNFTQVQKGPHTFKIGARVRTVSIDDLSPANFNGQWTFAGGATGLTSLQRYQKTLQLQRAGMSPAQIRAAGGGASQFSIVIGNPMATVQQFDIAPFVQDDWRVRPNLVVSYGLRYEIQSNASSHMGFAPRLAIAWSPGILRADRSPKTVVRAGIGIFYRRFSELSTLNVNHLNGLNIQQFIFSESGDPMIKTDPLTLAVLNSLRCADGSVTPDCVTSLPSLAGATPQSQTVWRIAPDLRVPTVYLAAAQVERQLPHNFTLSIGASARRIVHAILIRDTNAPIPGTVTSTNPEGIRPNPALGEIDQFEGNGNFRTAQLLVSFNSRLNARVSFNGSYTLSKAMSDTDGQNGSGFSPLPMDSYDLRSEWGPPLFDIRHRFTLFGTYANPRLWGLSFAPFIVATSGPPFNIITGIDSNLDRQFTDRPAFAGANPNCESPVIKCTRFGNFKLSPAPGDRIIPRNFGRGPSGFLLNLRISRSFDFGEASGFAGRSQAGSGNSRTKAEPEKKYHLSLSVAFENLLNNVNLAAPIGNLSSPFFGQSQSLAGISSSAGGSVNAANRRVYLNVRFGF